MTDHLHPGPHPDADQLNAYREGVLPEHERIECLAHLAECGACRKVIFITQGLSSTHVPAAPTWKRWLAPVPLLSGALAACTLLLVVSLHFYHISTSANQKHVATGNQASPAFPADEVRIPAPAPAQIPSEKKLESPPPIATAQPRKKANTGAVFGSSSSAGAGLSSDKSLSVLSSSTSEAMKAAAAAPPPPAAPASPIATPQQLLNNGVNPGESAGIARGNGASVTSEFKGNFAGPSSNGSLSVRIEHDRGPANGLSEVTGRVMDQTGSVIAGAAVTLHQSAGIVNSSTQTDAFGQFSVSALPAGRYELQITSPGFKTISRQIELQPRDLALLDSVLPIGTAAQTVTVESQPAQMETQSAAISFGSVATGGDQGQKLHPLPSKLPISRSVSLGDRLLALDSAGNLFLSKNTGKHWKAVKPQWPGKVVQITGPTESLSSGLQKKKTTAASESITPSTPSASAPSGFQLTTDSGSVWSSQDGRHWHRQQP